MTTAVGPLPPRLFVGREREMRDLLSGLEDACASRGRIVLLVGEPGIGKTRTTEELAMLVRARGALVLVGRCYEGEGAPPYWPWVQLLRTYARAADPATMLADMGRGAAEIVRVIDGLGHELPDLPADPTFEAEQARFRFFDSLTTFLKNAARRQPLVLILDDLHWADQASLLLLQFVAREIAEAAVLLVGAYRDVEIGPGHPFLDALGELAREPVSRVVPLRGLSHGDVAHFMEGVGGSAPPASVVTAVYERTEGNPFFVSQLVRLLAPEGDWVQAAEAVGSTIPLGVQEVIAERLSRLSPAARHVLEVAAVAGREFDLRVVAAAVTSVSADANATTLSSVEMLLDPLEEAIRQRMVSETPGTVHGYIFSHALIRDALYAGLSARQRVHLHRSIGESLEALYPSAPDTRLAQLAYHFFEATPGGGDAGKAVAYARRAAEHAKATLAYEEAARCYELALRTLTRQAADEHQHGELLLALGEAHHNASNETAARAAFQQAAAIARRLDAAELLARTALGYAGIVIGVAVDQQVVAVLEEGLEALGPQDSALRAMLLARLAMELFFSPDAEHRAAVSAEAVATARRAGDALALVHALEARHFALWGQRGPAERLALVDEMSRLAVAINNVDLVMHGHNLRVNDLLELGRIDEVDATIGAYARLVDELRQPSYQWGLGMCRAMRAMMDGRFADAEELASAALVAGQRVQPQTAANFFAAQMFFLRREQGRLAELEDALQGAVAAFPTVPAWRCALASLYAELDRTADAARELDRVASAGLSDLPRDNSWLVAVTVLAEVAALLGDQRCAAVLYEQLLPHAGLVVVAGIAAACNGAVDRTLGLLAGTLGRWDDGVRHFEQALAINRRLGARPFVARTQHEYAALLLAAGDAGARDRQESIQRARALLDEAYAIAGALGMDGLEVKARMLKGRIEPAATVASHTAARPPLSALGTPEDSSTPPENLFRLDDDHWILMFEGRTCRLKDAKGLRYIAVLPQEPHRSIHVTELLRGETGTETEGVAADAARAARDRLRDLRGQLEEAERFNDLGVVARAQAEIDVLTQELADHMGLAPSAERATDDLLRLRVTKAIKAAARKIGVQHPALGHHLQSTIRTGSFCSYAPDPTKPIRWR